MMTKKIVWRLKEQPTTQMLEGLVLSGILAKDEAREILFNLEDWEPKTSDQERSIESLESEIKFLRELVEKLSQNKGQIVEIIREVERPWKRYPWWEPYWSWTTTVADTSTSLNTMSPNVASSNNFSGINTF